MSACKRKSQEISRVSGIHPLGTWTSADDFMAPSNSCWWWYISVWTKVVAFTELFQPCCNVLQKVFNVSTHLIPNLSHVSENMMLTHWTFFATLTFVIFSHPSSETVIISLTLTAQPMGFISSYWFLTHTIVYTDRWQLILPAPQPPSLLCGLLWSSRCDLAGSTWAEEIDKNTHHTILFFPYEILSPWPCHIPVLLL